MSTATQLDYSELDDEWEIDGANGVYTSINPGSRPNQRLVFNEWFRDGAISAEIAIRGGAKLEDGGESRLAAFLFRYQNPNNYYFAGIGGFNGKFFIGKMANGQDQALVTTGSSGSIKRGVGYRVRVHCAGNWISLSHNEITQLSVIADTFNSGPWGLHTWRTKAEFRGPRAEVVKPTCFVIMPFASEFDDVYQVIRQTVREHSLDCIRADERYLTGPIMADITDQIEKADLIIADFTGKNPNVFYEAGYAAARRKPVVQIAQSVSDLPFDVRHLRTFSYHTKILGDQKLAYDLSEAIRATMGFGASSRGADESPT